MKKTPLFILLFLMTVTFGTVCTNNDAQNQFEAEAYTLPEGYTETDSQRNIINEDADDWRISPIYVGLIEVIDPVFPNPVNYGTQFDMYIRVDAAPAGSTIQLYYFNEVYTRPIIIDSRPVTDDFTDVVFQINTNEFGNASEARGLHRLLIFDGNQRIITFGDLLIQ